MVHFVFKSIKFAVKAGGTKPPVQNFALEITPQPRKCWRKARRIVGWLGASQSACAGFEPLAAESYVLQVSVFLSERWPYWPCTLWRPERMYVKSLTQTRHSTNVMSQQ